MPKPFLYSELSNRQRAAYPYVIRGVREGKTQREIETALRGMDLGIRHEVMRLMVAHEKVVQSYSDALKLLRPSDKPVSRNLPEALTQLARKYAFTIEVTGTLISSGKPFSQFVTLSLDTLMTRGAMEELAADIVGSNKRRYGLDVEESTIFSGLRAGEKGSL